MLCTNHVIMISQGATGKQGKRGKLGDKGSEGNSGAVGPPGPSGPTGKRVRIWTTIYKALEKISSCLS